MNYYIIALREIRIHGPSTRISRRATVLQLIWLLDCVVPYLSLNVFTYYFSLSGSVTQETPVSKFKHTLVCYLWYLTYRVFFKIYISYKRFLIDMTMNMVSIAFIYLYCKKILLKPKFLTCIVFEIHHKKILNRTSVQLLLCMICMHLLPV